MRKKNKEQDVAFVVKDTKRRTEDQGAMSRMTGTDSCTRPSGTVKRVVGEDVGQVGAVFDSQSSFDRIIVNRLARHVPNVSRCIHRQH